MRDPPIDLAPNVEMAALRSFCELCEQLLEIWSAASRSKIWMLFQCELHRWIGKKALGAGQLQMVYRSLAGRVGPSIPLFFRLAHVSRRGSSCY